MLLQIEKKLSTEYFCHHVNRNKKLSTTLAKFLVRQTDHRRKQYNGCADENLSVCPQRVQNLNDAGCCSEILLISLKVQEVFQRSICVTENTEVPDYHKSKDSVHEER